MPRKESIICPDDGGNLTDKREMMVLSELDCQVTVLNLLHLASQSLERRRVDLLPLHTALVYLVE